MDNAVSEATAVESYGGRIVFLPLFDSLSTSGIIQRIRESTGAIA